MRRLQRSLGGGAAAFKGRLGLLRGQRGFTLIEVVMGMVLFAIVALALVGLLQSAIAANGIARQKTISHQLAQQQVEYIRNLDYTTEVGISGGNPNGVVAPTSTINVKGLQATMTTTITWVDDPTPASYSTQANYKKVTVTIRSTRTNLLLTSVVTYVAPPGRAPFGGINNAVINVIVQDMGPGNPKIQGALVDLTNGPSSPLSDTTDSIGLVTFPALTANPTTGPTAYYDIGVTKSGYVTYVGDRSPNAPAHRQVAPSQTDSTTIQLYKPSTINVNLRDSGGNPYTALTTVKVSSSQTSTTQSYTTSGSGSLSVTTFAGEPVVPGDFTVRAFTGTGLCSDPVASYVPDNYPSVMTSTFTLVLVPCPTGSLQVNVTQLGGPAAGATVSVSNGPNDYTPITQTTNASGQTTFTNLPSGTDPYTISVTDAPGNVTQTTTQAVATGVTTPVTVALADPPMGSINTTVQWLGSGVNLASVVVTGGPYNITRTLSTNASGQANFTNVIPAGTGYTITATKNGQSATATSVTVTAGSTTSRTIAMPVANLTVTATWVGQQIGSGTNNVTITGGPNAGSYTGSTNASGVAVVSVPQTTSSYPYTVTVTKNGGSGSSSVTSVPAGGQSTSVAFTQVGTITVTAQWASVYAGNASVSITGGPVGGTFGTGTTTASTTGVAPAVTVPATTSAFPYTVTVTKGSGTGSASVTTVANGANVPQTVAITPTKTFVITLRRGGVNAPNTQVNISITGGPNGTAGAPPAYTFTVTSNGSAILPALTVPQGSSGSTYTIKANLTTCGASGSNRSGQLTAQSNTGASTSVTLNMASSTCPFSPLP